MEKMLRLADARQCWEGKTIAVILSLALALSFLNLSMSADYAKAEGFDGEIGDTPTQTESPNADPAEDETTLPGEFETPVNTPASVPEESAVEETVTTLSTVANDGTSITVTADDGFPSGVTLHADYALTDQVAAAFVGAENANGQSLQVHTAYLLSFFTAEGVSLSPEGSYTVAITLNDSFAENLSIYRMVDASQVESVEPLLSLTPQGTVMLNDLTFTTSFPSSTFVITAPKVDEAGEGSLESNVTEEESADTGKGSSQESEQNMSDVKAGENGGLEVGLSDGVTVQEAEGDNALSGDGESVVLYEGEVRDLSYFATTGQTWSSENPAVATVSAVGVVTAVSSGVTLVRCGDATFQVTVRKAVADAPTTSTVDMAYFYFLPPSEDGTATELSQAKYLGSGLVKVPTGCESSQPLFNGTVLPLSTDDEGHEVRNKIVSLADLIIAEPTDREVRLGLAAYYNGSIDEGSSKITAQDITGYSLEPLQISGEQKSWGYKQEALTPASARHIYVSLSLETADRYSVTYKVAQPSGLQTRSVLHEVSEAAIALPFTGEQSLLVDGAVYPLEVRAAGEEGESGMVYRFDGWYTDATYHQKAPAIYDEAAAATFYARYVSTAASTVTFDAAGGTFAHDAGKLAQAVDEGAAYWMPAAPRRFGYDFAGWALEGSDTVYSAGAARTMGASDVAYQALWTPQAATITLDGNGGSFNDGEATYVLAGETGGSVAAQDFTLTKPGYQLVGWATAPDGAGQTLSTLPDTFSPGNLTLYAQYVEDPSQRFTVTYRATTGGQVSCGLTPAGDVAYESNLFDLADIKGAQAESLWSSFYTFMGWRMVVDGVPGQTVSDSPVLSAEVIASHLTKNEDGTYADITFEAWFEVFHVGSGSMAPYFVNYYLMGDDGTYGDAPACILRKQASFAEGQNYGVGEYHTGNAADDFAFLKTEGGLTDFDASLYVWDKEEPRNVTTITYNPASSAIFKVYLAKKMLVRFDAGATGRLNVNDDSSLNADGTTVAWRLLPGEAIPQVPVVLPYDGYEFTGWTVAGTTVDEATFEAPITQAVAYEATYRALPAAISFDAQGGLAIDSMEGVTGQALSTSLPIPVRTGYTFCGWYDNAAFKGDALESLPSVFPAGETTYYARWSADEAYIRFDRNAADATGSQMGLQGVTDGEVTDLAFPEECGFVRAGYTFVGWNTKADGSGDRVSAFPENFAAGTTTYYAQWQLDTSWLTAEAFSWEGTYDGRAHGIVWPAGLALKEGETLSVTVEGRTLSASQAASMLSNVEDSAKDVTVTVADANGTVLRTIEGVQVNVIPAALTVTTSDLIHPYNGQAAASEGIAVEGLVAGETVGYHTTGSALNVGDVAENTFELEWANPDNDYTAKESNYTVEAHLGTIRVVTSECPVTIEGYAGTYDGQEHAIVYSVDEDEPATLSFDAPLTYSNAGAHAVNFTLECADHGTFTGTVGLYIAQRPVAIAADDSFKLEATADPEFTGDIVAGDLVEDHDLGVITFARVNDDEAVGLYEDAITAEYLTNDNYAVEVFPGTFTIGPVGSKVVPPRNPLLPAGTRTEAGIKDGSSGETVEDTLASVVRTVMGMAQAVTGATDNTQAAGLRLEAVEEGADRGEFEFEDPTVTRVAGETIADDETPMGAFDEPRCWVHWAVLLGILATLGYGFIVASSRRSFSRRIEDFEASILVVDVASEEVIPAAVKVRLQ